MFSKDVIAPILYKNCTGCHRPGEIAPMSLLTYRTARPYARSIAAQVTKDTMPPWNMPTPRMVSSAMTVVSAPLKKTPS